MISHMTELHSNRGMLLATNISRVLKSDRKIQIVLRALIDPCSQASFVLGSLCQRLKLQIKKVNMSNKWTGSISFSVQKSAQVLIEQSFDSLFSCLVDTFPL